MEMRTLPGTDLRVSPLCLGTMTFGTPVGEAQAIEIVHWALDHGINFIDTANMYEGYARYIGSPGGVAEDILGKALQGRRAAAILATKVGMKIGPGDDDEGLSRKHILREVERSLARLRTDYIDLYYMHKPDPKAPLPESVQAFDDLLRAGKIRAWGFSNFSASQVQELLTLCDRNGWRRPVASQSPYSLLKREIEADLVPLLRREGLALIPYQVLQGGLLAGKYRRGQDAPAGSRGAEKPQWLWPLTDDLYGRLQGIEHEAQAKGRTLLHHAVVGILEQPAVASVILGVKSVAQLEALRAMV